MFREMRKSAREISYEESIRIIEKCDYGILSVLGENGYAYGVPLNYIFINGSIYIHCAGEGFKIDSLRKNPKVSFTIVGETEILSDKFSTKYESAIIFGEAKEINGDEKTDALKGLIEKYSKDFKEEGMKYIERAAAVTTVVKIETEKITGKARR